MTHKTLTGTLSGYPYPANEVPATFDEECIDTCSHSGQMLAESQFVCGIAGIIGEGTTSGGTRDLADRMAGSLRHRGPDEQGTHNAAEAGLAFGHRRLSILDLSPSGSQPMTSGSGRWTIVLNGEIYNHRPIRQQLSASGTQFRGTSDTEVALEAIAAWGIEAALRSFEGMFAFAAFDASTRRLVLARDRLGEKPLYWWHDGHRFAFASELRALREIPGIDLQVDPASAAALLRWSFIPHPHTIYCGVRQLEPGTLLEVEIGEGSLGVNHRRWWSLGDTVDSARRHRRHLSMDQAVGELRELLADSVAERLESDVPLGAFLSGGIDSSLVAAFAQQALGGKPLSTFTVSMPVAGLDEAAHAAAVAHHIGSRHQTLQLDVSDAFDLIPRLAQLYDEPFADPSMLPSVLLCRAASQHVSVCLGGDGGDEVFAGYNRHALGATIDRFGSRSPAWLSRSLSRAALAVPPNLIDRVGQLLPGDRIPQLADKVHKAASLLGGVTPIWETLASVWPAHALGVEPHHPTSPALPPGVSSVEEVMLIDTGVVLPDQMLVKVDRASMASSLEVRSPFLDTRLLEWSWSLPMELKARRGTGKLVVRELAAQMLPPHIAERRKLGFDPPLATWLRSDLRPWAEDLLARPRCVDEGWLDRSAVRDVWREHLSGRRNHEYQLWAVLMLESWMAEHQPQRA